MRIFLLLGTLETSGRYNEILPMAQICPATGVDAVFGLNRLEARRPYLIPVVRETATNRTRFFRSTDDDNSMAPEYLHLPWSVHYL